MTVATATATRPTATAQAQAERCSYCQGRGYTVVDFRERDGEVYSVTVNCICRQRRREPR